MSEPLTPEAFSREVERLKERHPEWFSGQQAVSGGPPLKERNLPPLPGPQKAGTQPWKGQERLDWAEKAAGEGAATRDFRIVEAVIK